MAADPDGNLIRVFYDFRGDIQENDTSRTAGKLVSLRTAKHADCHFAVDRELVTLP